jgi:hypothetical protein
MKTRRLITPAEARAIRSKVVRPRGCTDKAWALYVLNGTPIVITR